MMRNWLSTAILLACSHSAWAIYGPDLTRADASVALRACQEANFQQGREITKAIASGKPDDILQVLADAVKEWKATPKTSPLYPARAFCLHELVPSKLEPKGYSGTDPVTWREPTSSVMKFNDLGIEYFYYSPDGVWRPSKDPVDLNQLATEHLGSRWGRQAFLMMTQLGWSQGACQEGPDQFRAVIKHGEAFLSQYPDSEVSDSIRLELANAYASWWNVSNLEPNESTNPESYKAGALKAKQRAVQLYQEYLRVPNAANQKEAQKRLAALERNPKGSETYDYFCDDYED